MDEESSNQRTEINLVTNVYNYPELYNVDIVEYCDTLQKQNAWTKIADQCGLTGRPKYTIIYGILVTLSC